MGFSEPASFNYSTKQRIFKFEMIRFGDIRIYFAIHFMAEFTIPAKSIPHS